MIITEENYLNHFGTPRKSGRYPYGSGGPEATRNRTLLEDIAVLKKQGMTDAQIAKSMNFSRNELTAKRSIANAQQKRSDILMAQRLREKGNGYSAIGRRMGKPESSVRALLAEGALDKVNVTNSVADMLKSHVDEKLYIDVGKGVEHHIGISRTKLDVSLEVLKQQDYPVFTIHIPQANLPGQFTPMKVLAHPGATLAEVNHNRAQIRQITEYSDDGGRSFLGLQKPISVNSKRIAVNYGPDGGAHADGVIYVRPGVKDLQIGSKRYGQVRVAVDGTHFLKGMAIYKDDLPDGVDLVFNTNKTKDVPLKSKDSKTNAIFKKMEDDPDNPFGSIVRQIHDPATGKVSSAMNLVNEEGAWDKWSKTLSSQMLSKQSPKLAEGQLKLTFDRRQREFDEIKSLTNPTVRKELLLKFGDSADSAAVHLKAASLPRQATKVILPIQSIKPGEIYSHSFKDGETVALIRHPHGGTFEIPQLTVNNRNREARKILGDAQDAIGIHHTVAQRLSGADFDGDTVLVIPNNRKQIISTPALEGLKNFDPQVYRVPKHSPIPRITAAQKQQEMGKISNLITDMTIHGAKTDEVARAIRHSMVVIDSEKHNLDFKQSEKDNGIHSLKLKYQSKPDTKGLGASTLISRANADHRIPQRRPRSASDGGPIDPRSGKKVFVPTNRMIVDSKLVTNPRTGRKEYLDTSKTKPKLIVVRRLSVVDDAHTLKSVPGTVMETIYANHSNKLKDLGNTARKEAVKITPPPKSASAAKVYAKEVQSLNAKLRIAERNAPLERNAQLLTSVYVAQARRANPQMDKDDIKKIRRQALDEARIRSHPPGETGKEKISLTKEEWNAIQAGAIAPTKLEKIIRNSDLNVVKALALPKHHPKMTSTNLRRAQSMLKAGFTQAEVADALGVGLTTLKVSLSE